VRVSGARALEIAKNMLGFTPRTRYAHFTPFLNTQGETLDEGIALYFKGPNSFTGEDILELQAHGGPVVLDRILQQTLKLGAQMAEPGAFSMRAFLNNKIDLVQAEAVADLIEASSEQAANWAVRTLQGEFSKKIKRLLEQLIQLRLYCEAAIDFPEEEIDFLKDARLNSELEHIKNSLAAVQAQAHQGVVVKEGVRIVIAGKPNVGKSSLMNCLAGLDLAIVTDVPGTTRDLLNHDIHIAGISCQVTDTAGLRDTEDKVEKIGVARAGDAIENADYVLLVLDSAIDDIDLNRLWPTTSGKLPAKEKLILVQNKIDLYQQAAKVSEHHGLPLVSVSAKTGEGVEVLCQQMAKQFALALKTEGGFSARRRHLEALEETADYLQAADKQLKIGAGELLCEDLRLAQQALGKITGEFSADDLLGKIFSEFCIGK